MNYLLKTKDKKNIGQKRDISYDPRKEQKLKLELYKTLGPFTLGEKLGEGTFGVVRLGIHSKTGEKVAVKILDKNKILEKKDRISIEREIKILKFLHHENIIQLYSSIQTKSSIFLIMEYAPGKELFDYISKKRRLSEFESSNFYLQVLSGINYLSKNNICHRDIKPENLLLNSSKNKIKIADFGLSIMYKNGELLKTACGSPSYASPEMLKGEKYDGLMSDIWSSGIVLYAMICGFLPFEDDNNDKLYEKILIGKFEIPPFVSDNAKDLIRRILVVNPNHRLKINQIIKHPWFKQFNDKISLNNGLSLKELIIPIDEEIVQQMIEFGYKPEDIRKNILSNRHNHATTVYYLLVKAKVREGKSSVSDLGGEEFLKYSKDNKNKISNYTDKEIEQTILDRTLDNHSSINYINKNHSFISEQNRTRFLFKENKSKELFNTNFHNIINSMNLNLLNNINRQHAIKKINPKIVRKCHNNSEPLDNSEFIEKTPIALLNNLDSYHSKDEIIEADLHSQKYLNKTEKKHNRLFIIKKEKLNKDKNQNIYNSSKQIYKKSIINYPHKLSKSIDKYNPKFNCIKKSLFTSNKNINNASDIKNDINNNNKEKELGQSTTHTNVIFNGILNTERKQYTSLDNKKENLNKIKVKKINGNINIKKKPIIKLEKKIKQSAKHKLYQYRSNNCIKNLKSASFRTNSLMPFLTMCNKTASSFEVINNSDRNLKNFFTINHSHSRAKDVKTLYSIENNNSSSNYKNMRNKNVLQISNGKISNKYNFTDSSVLPKKKIDRVNNTQVQEINNVLKMFQQNKKGSFLTSSRNSDHSSFNLHNNKNWKNRMKKICETEEDRTSNFSKKLMNNNNINNFDINMNINNDISQVSNINKENNIDTINTINKKKYSSKIIKETKNVRINIEDNNAYKNTSNDILSKIHSNYKKVSVYKLKNNENYSNYKEHKYSNIKTKKNNINSKINLEKFKKINKLNLDEQKLKSLNIPKNRNENIISNKSIYNTTFNGNFNNSIVALKNYYNSKKPSNTKVFNSIFNKKNKQPIKQNYITTLEVSKEITENDKNINNSKVIRTINNNMNNCSLKSEVNPLKLSKISLNNNNLNKLNKKELVLPKNLKAQIINSNGNNNTNNMNMNNKINNNSNNNIFLINSHRVSNNFNIISDLLENKIQPQTNLTSFIISKEPDFIRTQLIKNLKNKKITYFMKPKNNEEVETIPYVIYCEKDPLKLKIEINKSVNKDINTSTIQFLKLDGNNSNYKNVMHSLLLNII